MISGRVQSGADWSALLAVANLVGSTTAPPDFASELRLRIAGLQPQIDFTDTQAASELFENPGLADPESAYRMMTEINRREVVYKAEFSEMSEMKGDLGELSTEAHQFSNLSAESGLAEIRIRLQHFTESYNRWIDRFDQELEPGGLLAGTQAARVAQWELEVSIGNMFFGAGAGLHGLRDLGIQVDPVTDRITFDQARFDAVAERNRSGVVATLREFGANFSRSADLLISEGNFVPARLTNLERVIDYIDQNKAALQAEFGTGDVAKPEGYVAKALASYRAMNRSTG